jgi:hypothetical protein
MVAMVASYALWMGRGEWPAAARVLPAYAAAVLVQCAHLAEEYASGFHRVFPPVLGAEPWSGGRFLAFNLAWLAVFAAGGTGLARGKRPAYLVASWRSAAGSGTGWGTWRSRRAPGATHPSPLLRRRIRSVSLERVPNPPSAR